VKIAATHLQHSLQQIAKRQTHKCSLSASN
jgi:hypothetical protein